MSIISSGDVTPLITLIVSQLLCLIAVPIRCYSTKSVEFDIWSNIETALDAAQLAILAPARFPGSP
jgi:hypothetical protein